MKYKLIFIVPSLSSGGAEKNTINIINTLDNSKYDIILISCCKGPDNLSHLISVSAKIVYLNKSYVSSSFFKIYQIISKAKPSIVFSSLQHVSSLVSLIYILKYRYFINIIRIPTLPSNHLETKRKEILAKMIFRFFIRYASVIITQTNEMKMEVISCYKIKKDKIITIPNLVNVKQVRTLANHKSNLYDKKYTNIVFVGKIYPVKGLEILIPAIKILKNRVPNIQLHLIGDGDTYYVDKINSLISKLCLNDNIIFHGYQKNPYPYIKEAKLLILPSLKEGFPNVILEALALGKPVVSTNCINYGSIINSTNGIIVKVNSIEDMSKGIMEALSLEPLSSQSLDDFDFNKWFYQLIKNESITSN